MFMNAIAIDSTYDDAYSGLADLYNEKSWGGDTRYDRKRDSILNIAYRINPKSANILRSKGLRYSRFNSFNIDSALFYLKKSDKEDPGNVQTYNAIGWLFIFCLRFQALLPLGALEARHTANPSC